MNKGLEALENIANCTNNDLLTPRWFEWLQTIKQDLERLETLEKENKELIVNKNVAQAVALNQKREISELKDQVAYLKEDSKEWQSAYEWSQAQNAILKLKIKEFEEVKNENKI